jgi:lysozyme
MITSSTTLERQLIANEGLKLTPYRCTANKLTVGCGRNLDDVGLSPDECKALGVTPKDYPHLRLTEAQALILLRNDIKRCEKGLDEHIPWWRVLDEVRQRVLIDMCFNLGIAGLCAFKRTLALIQARDYAGAATAMLASKWSSQVKGRATRLASMMRTGA